MTAIKRPSYQGALPALVVQSGTKMLMGYASVSQYDLYINYAMHKIISLLIF